MILITKVNSIKEKKVIKTMSSIRLCYAGTKLLTPDTSKYPKITAYFQQLWGVSRGLDFSFLVRLIKIDDYLVYFGTLKGNMTGINSLKHFIEKFGELISKRFGG